MDIKVGSINHSPQATAPNVITILKYFYIAERCIANITCEITFEISILDKRDVILVHFYDRSTFIY